jgi:protein-disulfide isomerase
MYESTLKKPVSKSDHLKGSVRALVNIVEYADFQCPFCATAAPVLDQLFESFRQSMCFAYRHFPITSSHEYAVIAALTAEAAGKQGKFWNMHDALFDNQETMSEDTFSLLARELGLNMTKFEKDLDDKHLIQKIQDDFNSGVESGVHGTPTVFINGIRYEGEISFEHLASEVRSILEQNQSSL